MSTILLNRYKIIKKMGEGGMGVVWKVYDETEGKEVALKEIKYLSKKEEKDTATVASATAIGKRVSPAVTVAVATDPDLRFAEEFRSMKKLQYPNTIKVFDYGVLENGNKYITMEIVEGEILKDLLKTKKTNQLF